MSESEEIQLPSRKTLVVVAGIALAYVGFAHWLDSYRVPRWYKALHVAKLRGIVYRSDADKFAATFKLANDLHTYTFFPRWLKRGSGVCPGSCARRFCF